MTWACVYTHASMEDRAIENLTRQGFEAFCPKYLRPNPVRITESRPHPLFPCYAFVNLAPDQPWLAINSTKGVIRLLTDRVRATTTGAWARPLAVPDSFIARFLTSTEVEALPPDTVVRVRQRESSFYDLAGTVVGLGRDERVRVMMCLFNRDMVVEFAAADLEVVDRSRRGLVTGRPRLVRTIPPPVAPVPV